MNRPLLSTLIGALTLLAATSAFAQDASSLLGHWHGAGQSDTDRRFIIPCIDELIPGENNRFSATFTLDLGEIIPCVFPVESTLSRSGVITGNGVDDHGHRIILHGKTRVMGGSVRVGAFKYMMFEAKGGLVDDGHLALVQLLGGNDWENTIGAHLNSPFTGDFRTVDGLETSRLEASLFNERNLETKQFTTRMRGNMSFFDVFHPQSSSFFDVFFDLEGTVGVPAVQIDGSTIAPFASLGISYPVDAGGPPVISILTGQVVHPFSDGDIIPCIIPGDYRLYDSFFDVFTDVFQGSDSSFSRGTFLLTEQLTLP